MKMVKSLILGSAAGLVAMSGAQAADLPVKAKAVEYVRICSLYGAGFYYIPGTDTCIKLGGYLRMDVLANTNSSDTGNTNLPASANNRFTNAFTWRSREDLNIDTRTATEYGVVRTFFDATFTWTDDSFTASGTTPGATVYSQIGALGAGQANNGTSGAVAAGTLGVYYAFIQFAGFTMGKAVSAFSAPWANYPGNNYDGLVGGGGTITGVNQFVYTGSATACRLRSALRIRLSTIRPATLTSPTPPSAATLVPLVLVRSEPAISRARLHRTSSPTCWLTRLGARSRHRSPCMTTTSVTTARLNLPGILMTNGAGLVSWPWRSRTSRPALAT